MNRSYLLLLVMFLFLYFPVIAQIEDVEKVSWSEINRLKNVDFSAVAPKHSMERKLTNGKRNTTLEGYIYSGLDFVVEQKDNTLRFNVLTFMEPDQSWLRDTSSLSTLEHEQAHFDITEIFARKLRKELHHVRSANAGKKSYQKLFKLLEKEQTTFDNDQFGEDGVTIKWKSKIEKELGNLSEYSELQVVVQLK